ncbi:hypothetical protein GGS21DRAFT_524894 [Xylaria nigripes]|nr:hypothetical protein GGS21DRAFT_524894 [Xylaria nigripes]
MLQSGMCTRLSPCSMLFAGGSTVVCHGRLLWNRKLGLPIEAPSYCKGHSKRGMSHHLDPHQHKFLRHSCVHNNRYHPRTKSCRSVMVLIGNSLSLFYAGRHLRHQVAHNSRLLPRLGFAPSNVGVSCTKPDRELEEDHVTGLSPPQQAI